MHPQGIVKIHLERVPWWRVLWATVLDVFYLAILAAVAAAGAMIFVSGLIAIGGG